MTLLLLLLKNLILTILLEGAAIGLIFRRLPPLLYSVLANVMTNPALNLAVVLLVGNARLPYWPCVLPLELAAVLAEAWAYRSLLPSLGRGKPLLLSLGLNALSFGVGLLIG